MSPKLGLLAALVVAGFVAPATSASASYYRTTQTAYIWSGPGTQYNHVWQVPYHAQVTYYGCSYGWCDISWHGYRGYFLESYLEYYTPPPPPPRYYAPPTYTPPTYTPPSYRY